MGFQYAAKSRSKARARSSPSSLRAAANTEWRVSGKDSPGEVMRFVVEFPPQESMRGATKEARSRKMARALQPAPKLARLNCHGVGQVDRALHHLRNSDALAVFDIASKDIRLLPGKAPGIFHRDDGVLSRNHAAERETSVEIALVSPKQLLMRFRILGHKDDHNAGRRFFSALRKSLDI